MQDCVHTTPEELETAALFLWLGLPSAALCATEREEDRWGDVGLASTLIRHENLTELFENTVQTGGVWKPRALRFSVDAKHFENGAVFVNDDVTDNHVIPLFLSLTQTQIVAYSNSPGVVWTENVQFQSGTASFSNDVLPTKYMSYSFYLLSSWRNFNPSSQAGQPDSRQGFPGKGGWGVRDGLIRLSYFFFSCKRL